MTFGPGPDPINLNSQSERSVKFIYRIGPRSCGFPPGNGSLTF